MKNFVSVASMILFMLLCRSAGLAQVRYRVGLDADRVTYRVYLTSTMSYTGNSARISTAQVTLVVPHGTGPSQFTVTNQQNKQVGANTMFWNLNARVNAPIENPSADYLSFGFSGSGSLILFDMPANQEIELLSFRNGGSCLGVVTLINNTNDPFMNLNGTNNSQNTNPGNQITILGRGGDAYSGNYGAAANCTNTTPVSSTANLATTVTLDTHNPNPNNPVRATITVTNSGPDSATGVVSQVTLPSGQPISAQSASLGTSFVAGSGQWTIGTLTSGQSVTLTVTLSAATGGIAFVGNEITASGQFDPNSTPNNHVTTEDDQALTCFTVPLNLCPGGSVQVSIPAIYTGIQWFVGSQPIAGATASTLIIRQLGTYSVRTNGSCPTSDCCGVTVRQNDNCCTATICAPIVIARQSR